ncbi:MAG: type II secretion system protein [Planctomycetota bacterium]
MEHCVIPSVHIMRSAAHRSQTRFQGRSQTFFQGFTLIELLVAVAVIALLIGLIVPAISSSRRSAQIAVCLSHLKQTGVGLSTYASTYEFALPNVTAYQDFGQTIHWPWALPTFVRDELEDFGLPHKFLMCPLVDETVRVDGYDIPQLSAPFFGLSYRFQGWHERIATSNDLGLLNKNDWVGSDYAFVFGAMDNYVRGLRSPSSGQLLINNSAFRDAVAYESYTTIAAPATYRLDRARPSDILAADLNFAEIGVQLPGGTVDRNAAYGKSNHAIGRKGVQIAGQLESEDDMLDKWTDSNRLAVDGSVTINQAFFFGVNDGKPGYEVSGTPNGPAAKMFVSQRNSFYRSDPTRVYW